MKLSVIKAIWTGLKARNCGNIQQVLVLKFSFWPEKARKISGSFEKWAPGVHIVKCCGTKSESGKKRSEKGLCFVYIFCLRLFTSIFFI